MADEPRTKVVYPHYRTLENLIPMDEETIRNFEIPVKLTYTTSSNKRVYEAGEIVYTDMTFEYMTEHHKYIPNDEIEVQIHNSKMDDYINHKMVKMELIGEEKTILSDKNKIFKTRLKTTFLKKSDHPGFGAYSLYVSGKLIHGPDRIEREKDEIVKKALQNKRVKYDFLMNPIFYHGDKRSINQEEIHPEMILNHQQNITTDYRRYLARGTTIKYRPNQLKVGNYFFKKFISVLSDTAFARLENDSTLSISIPNNYSSTYNNLSIQIRGRLTNNAIETYTFDFRIIDSYNLNMKFLTETMSLPTAYESIKMISQVKIYSFDYGAENEVLYNAFKRPAFVNESHLVSVMPLTSESMFSQPVTLSAINNNRGNIGIEIELKADYIYLLDEKNPENLDETNCVLDVNDSNLDLTTVFEPKKFWFTIQHPETFCMNPELDLVTFPTINVETKFVRIGSNSNIISNECKILAKTLVGNFYTLQETQRYFRVLANYGFPPPSPSEHLYIYANYGSIRNIPGNTSAYFTKAKYNNHPFIYIKGYLGDQYIQHHIFRNDVLFHELGHYLDYRNDQYKLTIEDIPENFNFYEYSELAGRLLYKKPFCEAVADFSGALIREENQSNLSLDDSIQYMGVSIDCTGLNPRIWYEDKDDRYNTINRSTIVSHNKYELDYLYHIDLVSLTEINYNDSNKNAATYQKIVNFIWDLYDDQYSSYFYNGDIDFVSQNNDYTGVNIPDSLNFTFINTQIILNGLNNSSTVTSFIGYLLNQISNQEDKNNFINFIKNKYNLSPTIEIRSNDQVISDIDPENNRLSVPHPLHIPSGVQVTIPSNTIVDLSEYGEIVSDGTLIIGDNVSFYAKEGRNQIVINGACTIGSNLSLLSENSVSWKGMTIKNQTANMTINHLNLNYAGFKAENSNIKLNNPSASHSSIVTVNSDLEIDNGIFTNSGINSSSPFFAPGNRKFIIRNSSFNLEYVNESYRHRAISLLNTPNYTIENNQFVNCNGIYLHNSGWGVYSSLNSNVFRNI